MKQLKRLVCAVVLCLIVSLSALAGHTTPGYGWCEGDCIANRCNVCLNACDNGFAEQQATGEPDAATLAPQGASEPQPDLLVIAALFALLFIAYPRLN